MVRVAEPRRIRVRTRVRKRHRRSKKRLAFLLAGLGLLLLLGILTLVAASSVRGHLEGARSAMVQGRAALARGDIDRAQGSFQTARSAFIRARGSYRNPIFLGVGYLPLIGRSPDTVASVIGAGTRTAQAGMVIAAAAQDLPQGAAALAPSNGTIPLDPLETAAPVLERAEGLLEEAQTTLEQAPGWLVLGPVDRARDRLGEDLASARRAVMAASAAATAIPEFLGDDGPRRYFVAAQNPAELRGTGGFIGAYAILTADGGRLELSPFRTIGTLESVPPEEVEPPNPDFASRYDQFGGAGFWLNINMTPDFPSAATAIERLYELSEGEELDGVIAADPFALADMLEATGPAVVPGTSTEIDSDSVVPYVTNEAYSEITDSSQRKRLLGEVAREVLDRLLAGSTDPVAGGRALVEAAAEGHLLLHTTDPVVQASFEEAGVSGSLPVPTDLLAIALNNGAGNKIDYYLEQRIEYAVTLGAEGSATARNTVSLTNEAPTQGLPRFVIGPYSEDFEAGQNRTLLTAYCARACTLDSSHRDGAPVELDSHTELSHPGFSTYVELPSGGSQTLDQTWTVQGAWNGDDEQGVYRLTARAQPMIHPTRLDLDVQVPDGMEITGASPRVRVSGQRATWEGELTEERVFEIRFERPTLPRIWNSILDFLGRPVIRF